MKFAFFDAKSYDKVSFDKYGNDNGIEFKYFDMPPRFSEIDILLSFNTMIKFFFKYFF